MSITAKHSRRSIRLRGYDYTQAGAYFVTICAKEIDIVRRGDACVALNLTTKTNLSDIFGHIENGQMVLNDLGLVVEQRWRVLPEHHPSVVLDEFIVMPNHVHFIVFLVTHFSNEDGNDDVNDDGNDDEVRATQASPLQTGTMSGRKNGSLGTIIGSFKSGVTRYINELRGAPGAKVWQRNYYERIIRNEDELNHIREYIFNNPANWDTDEHNPERDTLGEVSPRIESRK